MRSTSSSTARFVGTAIASPPASRDLPHGLVDGAGQRQGCRVRRACGARDACARRRERNRGGGAHAAARAGDDRDLARRGPRAARYREARAAPARRDVERVEVAEALDALEHRRRLRSRARRSLGRRARRVTSSQARGVETVGRGRARSEYAVTVVLCRSFWLQSTKTFPARRSVLMMTVTRSGSSLREELTEGAGEVLGRVGRCAADRDGEVQPLRTRCLDHGLRARARRAAP